MAKTRMINTRFWSDNFISILNPLDRYLFLYFLTNEHTNIAGVYELPLKTMASETGIDREMLPKMIQRLKGKVFYYQGWIGIKNFQKHQSTTSEKVQKGIEIEMAKIPPKIKEKMDKLYGMDTLSDPIIYSNTNSNLNSNPKESQSDSGLIVALIDSFKEINPSFKKWYGNKTQRLACSHLIETHTMEQVQKVVALLPKTNGMQYFPSITTPVQLEDKWAALSAAMLRKKGELETKKRILI